VEHARLDVFGYLLIVSDANFHKALIGFCSAGLLWESVLHRYAQYCNCVRGRLLID
jgi:hypothetical protein